MMFAVDKTVPIRCPDESSGGVPSGIDGRLDAIIGSAGLGAVARCPLRASATRNAALATREGQSMRGWLQAQAQAQAQ